MKLELNIESIDKIIEEYAKENIAEIVRVEAEARTRDIVKGLIEEQVSDHVKNYIENYLETKIIKIGGGWNSDEEEKEYTAAQYLQKCTSDYFESGKMKIKTEDYRGYTTTKELSFDEYIKSISDIDAKVKKEIEGMVTNVKRTVSNNVKQVFDDSTKSMLAENVYSILMASDSYKKIQNGIETITGGR